MAAFPDCITTPAAGKHKFKQNLRRVVMKKFLRYSVSMLLIAALTFGYMAPVSSDDTMELNCKSAILIDATTGRVIYEKNAHEALPPASVTKIMTMLLTMEALDSGKITLDDKVTISKQASSRSTKGTMLLLDEGEVRTVKELLYGIAVESANDACIAMAEYIAGSEDEFVRLMNKKAAELGMKDTTFKNANGLHIDGHVTSAYDIALMSKELLKHQKIFDFVAKYMVTVYVGKKNDIKRELVNKNKMVRFFNDVDGIKTGFTDQAKYCISVTAKRNNLRLISVIMGAPDTTVRNREARKLLDYGFANYTNFNVAKAGDKIKEVGILKGDCDKINAVAEGNMSLLLMKGEEKGIQKDVKIPDKLAAPIKKGQKIGELIVMKDNKEIAKFNLVADREVTRASLLNNLKKSFKILFGE